MSLIERRDRERAQRHQSIIKAARELAEADGWDAVTTRRLAERVEYSQPVLYSHFAGKDAILRAVAIEGFEELAAYLNASRLGVTDARQALRAVCAAYLAFAERQPALYLAMFVLPTDVKFASPETPAPLQAGFGEFVAVVRDYAAEPELCAELVWAALHGLAVLAKGGRIPPDGKDARLDLLIAQVTGSGR